MATDAGRDDFIIAIRSAFLKKGTRQKFSLFTLLIISIFVLSLEYFKSGPIDTFRSIKEPMPYLRGLVSQLEGDIGTIKFDQPKRKSNGIATKEKNMAFRATKHAFNLASPRPSQIFPLLALKVDDVRK